MNNTKTNQLLLVKKAKNGDSEAFLKLCQLYQKTLYNSAYKILLNDLDVADCLQETEIRAWKNICNLKNESAFNSWIFKIMLNVSKNILKKKIKSIPFDESVYESVEVKSNLNELIEKLTDNYRIPIILFYYSGFSINEISQQLNISKNAVKIRLSRGRLQLKNLLEESRND